LNNKEAYKEPELHNNPRKTKKQIKNYLNRLKELGIEIPENITFEQEGRFFTEPIKLVHEIDIVR
jgi:hypothetical protein